MLSCTVVHPDKMYFVPSSDTHAFTVVAVRMTGSFLRMICVANGCYRRSTACAGTATTTVTVQYRARPCCREDDHDDVHDHAYHHEDVHPTITITTAAGAAARPPAPPPATHTTTTTTTTSTTSTVLILVLV